MKQYLLLFSTLLLLAACTSKHYAFRQKVNASTKTITITAKPKLANMQVAAPNAVLSKNTFATSLHKLQPNQIKESIVVKHKIYTHKQSKPYQIESDSTRRRKYKFDDEPEKQKSENRIGSNQNSGLTSRYDSYALTGFILSITGWLFYGITLIPAFIFSILGLKSTKRKGLAIAGLVISGIAIFLFLLIIILFIMAISSYG